VDDVQPDESLAGRDVLRVTLQDGQDIADALGDADALGEAVGRTLDAGQAFAAGRLRHRLSLAVESSGFGVVARLVLLLNEGKERVK